SLTDKAILSGTDNRPSMLEKDMYDSWKSRMELYMLNRTHGRMILESVEQGRQNFVLAGSSRPFTSGKGGAHGKQRVIMCYNCKGKGHMSKQCTKPRRKRDAEWFKDKVLLVQAQANGQVLQEEELEFLADPGTPESEIRANSLNHQERQVQSTSEQFSTLTHSNTKIESDSNIIPYSQYLNESQSNTVQNLTLPALQDDLILSVIEQLKTQVVTCTKINQDNKQAIGFQNPRYLKMAQQLKPNLYDGRVIGKSDVIVVPDSENTLMHAEEIQTDEPTHSGTTIVEVPKELPKVSMDLFTSFDQYLIDEVSEVQKIFKQMEMAVEQHSAAKTEFQTKKENVLKENDRLLTHALGVDIVNIVVNDCMNVNCLTVDACEQCVTTESELKTDFIQKENYETLLKQYHILKKHCISLELNNQLNTEIF
nr:hypothetical protein [Tanacetum cinerariifolium]